MFNQQRNAHSLHLETVQLHEQSGLPCGCDVTNTDQSLQSFQTEAEERCCSNGQNDKNNVFLSNRLCWHFVVDTHIWTFNIITRYLLI